MPCLPNYLESSSSSWTASHLLTVPWSPSNMLPQHSHLETQAVSPTTMPTAELLHFCRPSPRVLFPISEVALHPSRNSLLNSDIVVRLALVSFATSPPPANPAGSIFKQMWGPPTSHHPCCCPLGYAPFFPAWVTVIASRPVALLLPHRVCLLTWQPE